ncbi:MAG: crotonase/enoyl-CoA hydratase family protein [Pseudomonadota bacterium]
MRQRWQDTDRVTVAMEENGVAHVRLARAEKLNAIDGPMVDSLLAAGQALHDWPGLRAVVLAGEGRAFCAGLDLSTMTDGGFVAEAPLARRTHGNANRFQQVALQWRKLPCPVIAALHGACLGGGLQIAAGADIRIIAPDAQLCVMETKWGLVPDMGHFALWRGLVRGDVLRELTYTHRLFSGEEAVQLGFATHADQNPLARAAALADEIAALSPHAIRAAKLLAHRAEEPGFDAVLAAESIEQQHLLGSRNQREAVSSQREGRPGKFIDP